jgi:hypothetical protein
MTASQCLVVDAQNYPNDAPSIYFAIRTAGVWASYVAEATFTEYTVDAAILTANYMINAGSLTLLSPTGAVWSSAPTLPAYAVNNLWVRPTQAPGVLYGWSGTIVRESADQGITWSSSVSPVTLPHGMEPSMEHWEAFIVDDAGRMHIVRVVQTTVAGKFNYNLYYIRSDDNCATVIVDTTLLTLVNTTTHTYGVPSGVGITYIGDRIFVTLIYSQAWNVTGAYPGIPPPLIAYRWTYTNYYLKLYVSDDAGLTWADNTLLSSATTLVGYNNGYWYYENASTQLVGGGKYERDICATADAVFIAYRSIALTGLSPGVSTYTHVRGISTDYATMSTNLSFGEDPARGDAAELAMPQTWETTDTAPMYAEWIWTVSGDEDMLEYDCHDNSGTSNVISLNYLDWFGYYWMTPPRVLALAVRNRSFWW